MRAAVPPHSRVPPVFGGIDPLPLVYKYTVFEEPVSLLTEASVTVREKEVWKEGKRRGGEERKGGVRGDKLVRL